MGLLQRLFGAKMPSKREREMAMQNVALTVGEMPEASSEIHAKLQRIAATPRPPGDNRPRRLQPPLPESVVQEWERRFQVSLPPEFHFFITHLGNGGFVPGGDLYPLANWWYHLTDEAPEGQQDHWPRMPFRYEAPVGLTHGRLVENTATTDPDWPAWAGTISVCDLGCGSLALLVIGGPLRGRVCGFDYMTPPFLYPQQDFIAWYEAHLDAELTGNYAALHGQPEA
jgi:hypothetical protein